MDALEKAQDGNRRGRRDANDVPTVLGPVKHRLKAVAHRTESAGAQSSRCVHDRVDALERLVEGGGVSDITLDGIDGDTLRIRKTSDIERADRMSARKQKSAQVDTEKASPPGDQYG